MEKFKKIFWLIIIILVIFLSVFYFQGNKKSQDQDQVLDLINHNQEAINYSNQVLSEKLRGIDESDFVLESESKDPKLEIIIYEDLSDIYSVQFDETLEEIKKEFPDQVKIAWRPLVFKNSPLSESTYLLAECAKEQGAFLEMRALLLRKVAEGVIDEFDFENYANDLNLNSEEMMTCWSKGRYLDKIRQLSEEAEDFSVYGSPSIFVAKEIVAGARSWEDKVNGQGEELPGMKSVIRRNLSIIGGFSGE